MLVSLVLATVGRCDDVGRCLQSLAAQTDPNFEVLLIDQNADDRLVPWVTQYNELGLTIRHLRMGIPSLSGARNFGIEAANGVIVGFPDDDCWYEAEVIALVRAAFSSQPPKDGIVANWIEQSAVRNPSMTSEILSLQAWRAFRGGDASSISLFFNRELLTELHGFDERMGVGQWYGAAEETDLLLRALSAGAVIQRLPSARVHHSYGGQQPSTLAQRCARARVRARGTGAIYSKQRLGAWTVVRGLIAPLLLPMAHMSGWPALVVGYWTVVGRVEGMLHWGWGKP